MKLCTICLNCYKCFAMVKIFSGFRVTAVRNNFNFFFKIGMKLVPFSYNKEIRHIRNLTNYHALILEVFHTLEGSNTEEKHYTLSSDHPVFSKKLT